MDKLLVIAGTHQRENRLSYGVLDSLDSGLDYKDQVEVNCGESRAEINDYGKLVTAKIILSSDDLSLSEEGNKFHWTPVHTAILEQVNPLFYFDLHGWHQHGRNTGHTGAYIKPHSKVEYVDKIRKSLAGAQKDRPDIYGKGDRDFSDQTNNRDIIKKRIMKEQGLLGIFKRLCSTEAQRELFSKVSFESAKQWGNNWYLLKNDPRNADNNFNGYSCFTIEGIDEEKSQEPIANFILNYVLKLNPITTK
jgi:hypothetical protein